MSLWPTVTLDNVTVSGKVVLITSVGLLML